jgi:hypothetical protein
MASKKLTDGELVDALSSKLDDSILSSDYPIDDVQRELREAGTDPNEIGRWGSALVVELAKKRRLAWQTKAIKARDAMQSKLARRTVIAEMTRADLLRRIEEAKHNPRLTGPVSLAARNLSEAASTDDALRELVEDLEALALLTDTPED